MNGGRIGDEGGCSGHSCGNNERCRKQWGKHLRIKYLINCNTSTGWGVCKGVRQYNRGRGHE